MSEFSETVLENAKYIKENLQIFNVEAIERFLSKADSIVESLQTVNKKDTSASSKGIFLYYDLSLLHNNNLRKHNESFFEKCSYSFNTATSLLYFM